MKTKKGDKDIFEDKIGLKFNEGERKVTAFLTNFKTKTFVNVEESEERMGLLCYFQDEGGQTFKCYMPFDPYFYIGFEPKSEDQVRVFIENSVPRILRIEETEKVDLQQINHLSGKMKKYLKISFRSTNDLTNARKMLDIKKKKQNTDLQLYFDSRKANNCVENPKDLITDIRQYDVPYHIRVCIDTGLRAGKWFELQIKDKLIMKLHDSKKKSIPDLKVFAYDIQTSKDPFKFPQKQKDVVIMISIMYEGQAILIINTEFCGQAVNSFEYQPELKPQYKCHVEVYNTGSEKQTLKMFLDIIQSYKPVVITSYNGDRFDYPFIEKRCELNFINFENQMGVLNKSGQYFGNYVSHLDCFYWVERDAYLPQGSRGLKAVTRAKLKYQPVEVNPQMMVELAKQNTKQLAYYSVSDAVATFYLYMKHIHGFIFALSTIIPMMPDQVLRKGSGTLCENLLMAQAYNRNIIFPNKQIQNLQKFHRGHLLDTQTYTGGKVECLRSGIYRADFPTQFNLNPQAFQDLIDSIDQIIEFTVKHEKGQVVENIQNYQEIKSVLKVQLAKLKDVSNPFKHETLPLIYHIDVAAMYPNIIITNRLQPVAVVNDQICSGCLFNSPQFNCKRSLQWQWRGEYFPLNEGQFAYIKQKQSLKPDQVYENKFDADKTLKKQVRKYCQQVYRKAHIPVSQVRRDTVCMRQNSFYVDTVRAFRDRRYQYKGLVKIHKTQCNQMLKQKNYYEAKQQEKLMELFESMQLAHKIILNSFYGYVMRKGSRWYSMQTAAMVTYIGSNIINDSKDFVEGRIGKPLQLDTDGIWMLLPQGFPEQIKIKFKNGQSYNMSYPCQLLNHLIYEKYSNPQYQTLTNPQNFDYEIKKQMTIAFQIDGPYKAMFIPGGKQKKKTQQLDIQQHSTQMLKKRYVVFNFKNEVSEFKGLQMKRRGELNIIKMFQAQIFNQYVKGTSLKQCYQFCAQIAMKYFNFILNKGEKMGLLGILERLQQSKNLSKDVNQYGDSKGHAISSAKRLAEYLGPEVVKGKNLCCYYIISAYPAKKTVTERAIPTQIFFADMQTQKKFLYNWTKNQAFKTHVDIKDVLDWDYYKERLSTQIQKMVCIPAVMQNTANPIPDIQLPDWLQKKTFDMRHHKQQKIFAYGFGKNTFGTLPQLTSNKKINQVFQQQKKQQLQRNIFEVKNPITLRTSTKNKYSMKTDYKKWLDEQKRLWRTSKRDSAINQSIKFHQLKSILQIVPLQGSPGSFTIWYYSGNKIQQLLFNFQRHYYKKHQKGTKKAPRQQGLAMEIILDEAEFMKNEDYIDTILGSTFYETKIPLITNLVLKKGNLWRISKQLPMYRQQDIHEQFGSVYLPNIQQNFMPIVYVCRLRVLGNRQIFAVINPRLKQYNFYFVDNSIGKNTDQLLKLARKTIKRDDVKIAVKTKHTQLQAGKQINQLLQHHQVTLKQTYMIILQADCSTQYLRSIGIQSLQQQFPTLKIETLQIQNISTLDWRQKSLTKVIEQSLSATKHIINLLEWSRFTHIPICNLSQQTNLLDYITNITYGRLLHSGDNVTWWNQYNSDIISTYQSKSHTGRIIQPGLYSSYCIQINVDNLAVNTIANSQQLMVQDRQAAIIMQKNTKNTTNNKNNKTANKVQYLGEMTQAKKSFEYLKKMVRGWLKDLDQSYWERANDLLRNLHKWIITHSNSMFDPVLSKMVNQLMKKIFGIMMTKLTNLGMKIVFANFSKIIVSTDKHTYNQAQNSITYILKKCMDQNKKLFGYMTLNALGVYYQVLLYKDPFNYVGILVDQQQGAYDIISQNLSKLSLEQQQDQQQNNKTKKKIQYSFQITKQMNPIIADQFKNLLLQFVVALSDTKKQLVRQFADNKMKLILNYQGLIKQRMIAYIRNQFSEEVIDSMRRASKAWDEEYQIQKGSNNTVGSQKSAEQNQQQEDQDSFVVNDSQQLQDQLMNSQQLLQQQDQQNSQSKQKHSNKKHKKNKQTQMNFEKWGTDKQLDVLIQNLLKLLNPNDQLYDDQFDNLRKKAFRLLNEESSYIHKIIQPVYPQFQLPCNSCYLVNQQPGLCQHCNQPIKAVKQLENSIWKMMQEQGRDLYCARCNQIKQGYLKKCGCGGKWAIKQQPLKWLPYIDRNHEQWGFVNKVFQFMGIG